ncbi:MAG: HDIG domain-containing protein [Candidatus Margulisbacteria bacterium]|nr:HDIG domain-containing protein [Candidatus Margulisiibacteriota bacterium]
MKNQNNYLKTTIYSGLGLLMIIFVAMVYFPKNQHLVVGGTSPENIVSPKQFVIQTNLDKETSNKLLEAKIKKSEAVYKREFEIENKTKKDIIKVFLTLKELKEKKYSIAKIPTNDPIQKLSANTIKQLTMQDKDTITFLELISKQIATNIYSDGINADDNIQEKIEKHLNPFNDVKTNKDYGPLLRNIITPLLSVNMIYDEEGTYEKIEEIKRNFTPQTTTIKKGQPIVYKGDILQPINLEILQMIGLYRNTINVKKFLPLILGIIVLIFLLERMVSRYINPTTKQLLLLISLQSFYFLAIYFVNYFDKFPQYFEPGLLIPVSLFSILISLLISENAAYIITYFNILTMLLIFDISSFSLLYVMVANSLTTVLVRNFKTRRDIPLTGLIVGAISLVLMSIILLNSTAISLHFTLLHLAIIFLNPILCFIIAIGTIPYLEEIFGITTNLKLLDYSDMNNDLMKKLLNEAPGTYYHSLMVANLAEAAAESINANGVLARVAAYYHDIGKLKKPEYFIENQNQAQNPHEYTMPSLSALTILSHPKDGLEIAKKYGLPVEIQQIIHEHHGTSLLLYFYYKMLKSNINEIVEEEQFRYTTPKPSSKESVIIMLADGIEAAIRSLDKPTPAKIQSIINKIIKEKLDDHQLSNSDITLADLEKIKKTFSNVISNQYHSRIKYPDQEK